MIIPKIIAALDSASAIIDNRRELRGKRLKDISEVYSLHWLPNIKSLQSIISEDQFHLLDDSFSKLGKFDQRYQVSSQEASRIVEYLRNELWKIHDIRLRNNKLNLMATERTFVRNQLSAIGFNSVLRELNIMEQKYLENNWKSTCHHSRLALEEFFRIWLEQLLGQEISHGTLTQHVGEIDKLQALRMPEKVLTKGVYSFLSNTGTHATSTTPDVVDAQSAVCLNYSVVQHFLSRYL